MSNRVTYFLLCLAFVLASRSQAQDQPVPPKTAVKIELWMIKLDVAKLRKLDLTYEQFDLDGKSRKVKIVDVFEGKANDAPILQRPDQLIALLRDAGVVQVLCEPTLATLGGQKASLVVGRSKVDATPIVNDNGQIRLDIRAEHNEPTPPIGRRNPPGKKQCVIDTSVMMAPGKVGILP